MPNIQIRKSNGTNIDLVSLTKKVLDKTLTQPQEEFMLLATESGSFVLQTLTEQDPKLRASLILGGQSLVDWFLNFYLLGAMMIQTINKNGLSLEIEEDILEETSIEHNLEKGNNGNSQDVSTSTD